MTIFEPTAVAPFEGVSIAGEVIGVGTGGTTIVVSYVTAPSVISVLTSIEGVATTIEVEQVPFTGSSRL